MLSRIAVWRDRFKGQHSALLPLDVLASSASPTDPLESRLNWLVDVVQWIRRPGHEKDTSTPELQVQAGRLRRLLDVMDQNPAWKKSVAMTLRSIIRETSALDLFTETGLPRQYGMFQELGERLARKMLPPPNSAELGVLFERLFPHPQDDAWLEKLDEPVLQRLTELMNFETGPDEPAWNALNDELEDALFQLGLQIRIHGCSATIRSRIKHGRIRELPFFKLTDALQALVASREQGDLEKFLADLNYFRSLLEACQRALEEVLGHLEKCGVSTDAVYQIAFLEAALDRVSLLLELVFNKDVPLTNLAGFVARLVRENRARSSVRELVRQNFHLLTRKMVERNAETGEHYIARTPSEYGEMLRSAGGGGAIMAVTTWLKLLILNLHLPGFLQGLLASVNYSTGFVAIQLTGSTLATKQPANTAAALSDRMHRVREPQAQEELVTEMVCLIRSQFAAITGNLAIIVPTTLLLQLLSERLFGVPLMSEEKTYKTLASISIFGPSIIYAAFTGVLLWASSLVAAWAENWFVCHQVGEALAHDRRLARTLGPSRAMRFGAFWSRNIAGLAGNISFGFMLGLIPEFAKFAGIPLDIRHVTLSTSLLTAAAANIGTAVFTMGPFWLAVAGIIGIGIMNLTVSFSLAMFLAIRARKIQSPERHSIYRRLGKRALLEPWSFFLPYGTRDVPALPARP